MGGHDVPAPVAEEVLAEPERHRDVEPASQDIGQRERVRLHGLHREPAPGESALRQLQRGGRHVERSGPRPVQRVDERVGCAARTDFDDLEALQTPELTLGELGLDAPAQRVPLGIDLPMVLVEAAP
jgi:hypothetical protein